MNLSKTFNELWPPAEPGKRLATPNKLSLERPGVKLRPTVPSASTVRKDRR